MHKFGEAAKPGSWGSFFLCRFWRLSCVEPFPVPMLTADTSCFNAIEACADEAVGKGPGRGCVWDWLLSLALLFVDWNDSSLITHKRATPALGRAGDRLSWEGFDDRGV